MLMSLKRTLRVGKHRGTPDPLIITPPDQANVVGWYVTDALTPGELTTWADLAVGNDITQATASKRPDVLANTLNGRSVVRFAGDADIDTLADTTPALSAPTGITMHCAAKLTQATNYGMMMVGASNTTELRWVGDLEQVEAIAGTDFAQSAQSPGFYLNVWHQYTMTFDPATDMLRLFVDGTKIAENSAAASSMTYDTIRLGARNDTEFYFVGQIAEALFYRVALSEANVGVLADELRVKFPSLPG